MKKAALGERSALSRGQAGVDGSWISGGESCLEIAARPKPLSSSFVPVHASEHTKGRVLRKDQRFQLRYGRVHA